jgi:tetratricopeptide (TPR) repeat protein
MAPPEQRRQEGSRGKPPTRNQAAKKPAPRKGADRKTPPRAALPDPPKRKGWGSVARKGARVVQEDAATASEAWRAAVKRSREEKPRPRPEFETEAWIEEPEAAAAAAAAAPRRTRSTRPARLPAPVTDELTRVGGSTRAPRLAQRLDEATRAYERDRYQDARRILRRLSEEAPAAPAVRELYGLTLYRMGRWAEAIPELQAFRTLSGSFDQHPTLADCYRALRRHAEVAALWDELRQASPSAELVAEGRIVAAGSLADAGDMTAAIRLLERARLDVRRPRPYHLRLWYALADLYERAGDVPRARELFRRVVRQDPAFFDVAERVKALA